MIARVAPGAHCRRGQTERKCNGKGMVRLPTDCPRASGRRLRVGGTRLARAVLATVAVSAPAVGMLAPSAMAATADPVAANPTPSTTQELQAWNALQHPAAVRHPARLSFNQLAAA